MQDKFPYSDFNAIVWKEGERRTSLSLSPSILPSLPLWSDNDDDGDEGNLCESVQLSRVRVQRVRIDVRRRESRPAGLQGG